MSTNTIERNGKSYKVINPDTYIVECEWNGIVKAEKNGYIIAGESKESELFFKPKGQEQEFMRVSEDVALSVPWGKNGKNIMMTVDKGGYLNITNRDDVYGIAENEFNGTYRITFTVRSEVDRDIYEAGKSGTMREANVNAIIEKLAEHGIKASVDHDTDVKDIDCFSRNALECINSDRDDSLYCNHDTTVLKAELPNGISMKIITDEIPDRAAVAECQAPVSEVYHHEDAPKDRSYGKEYRPEVDYRITGIQGRIGDVTEKIAETVRAREISYGELIRASVQKYFPEKVDKVADSLLVRSELTADEKEMLSGGDSGYYSPNKTIIMLEGEAMDKYDTEGLVKEVEECGKLKEVLRSIMEQGDAELEKITEAAPQTQEERVSFVKDCQKFFETVLKNPIEGREHEYGKGFSDDFARYHELHVNKAVLATALASESLASCHMVTEATKKYKDELLDDSEKEYDSATNDEYMSMLEAEYGRDFAENEFAYAYDEYRERNHEIDEMSVAPASYIIQNHYASAIQSVSDIQKNISKDIIAQIAADQRSC